MVRLQQAKLTTLGTQLSLHAQQLRQGEGIRWNKGVPLGSTATSSTPWSSGRSTPSSSTMSSAGIAGLQVNINLIGTEHGSTLISTITALEYSGTQMINMLPEDTRHKLIAMLNRLDRDHFTTSKWLNINKVGWFGVKDMRYLRGSGQHPLTLELENGQRWVNYLASVNEWRLHQQGGYPNTAVEDSNMDTPRTENMGNE